MMKISVELEKQIRDYAREKYPEEMCGFIVDGKFHPVDNIHTDPENHFLVDPKCWLDSACTCTSFIHSHPDAYACPSELDMEQQSASGVPWGIISTNGKATTDIIFFGDQLPIQDYKNRIFCHGVTDCYSIIRDWYKQERGIVLKDFPRSWEWWEEEGKDFYTDNFKELGFKVVNDVDIMSEGPKVGDIFLASIGNHVTKINHGGVYTGKGLGLHHVTSTKPIDKTRVAKEEPIQRWLKYIKMWIRYEA